MLWILVKQSKTALNSNMDFIYLEETLNSSDTFYSSKMSYLSHVLQVKHTNDTQMQSYSVWENCKR